MTPFRYHVFVCDQQKPEGLPCCAARGGAKVIEKLRAEVGAQGLIEQVQVTVCGSLGLCERGPNMVVYPEGIWYSGVSPEDVPEIVREHFKAGRPVARLLNRDPAALFAEITENRNRYVASIRARDAAGVMPDELAQTIRGFQESRVLLTAIELDAFTAIGEGATAGQAAAKLGTDPRATAMLLNALVSLDVLRKANGTYHNTPVSARFFVKGSPDDARAAMMHTVNLWTRWSTLTDAVRKGGAVLSRDIGERGDEWVASFIAAMHHNARGRASQVVRAVDASNVRRLLDVGGGSGAYSIAFAQSNPKLEADILDLGPVVPIAQKHIEEAGLAARVHTRTGDLRTDDYGRGYDLVFISAICHMLGPDGNREMLRKAFDALEPGGRIVVQDFILENDKTRPRTAALFALNMLVGTQEGNAYSEREYSDWLAGAGFKGIDHVRLPGPSGLMIARKP